MHRTCDTFWSAAWLQGLVRVYDLRSSRPISERDHMILDYLDLCIFFSSECPHLLCCNGQQILVGVSVYSIRKYSNQINLTYLTCFIMLHHASSCFIMLHHASLYFSVQGMTTQSHPFVFIAADRNHLTCSWHLQIRVPSRYQCGIVLANMANPTGTIWNNLEQWLFLYVSLIQLLLVALRSRNQFSSSSCHKKGF